MPALFRPSAAGFDLAILLRRGALPGRAGDQIYSAKQLLPPGGAALAAAPPPPPPGSAAAALQPPPLRLARLPPALLARGAAAADALLVGFEPRLALLAALRARFGHAALFLMDGVGGDVIMAAVRPEAAAPQPPRLARLACARPAPGGGAALNVAELAVEALALGAGLVSRVEAVPPPGTAAGQRRKRPAGVVGARKRAKVPRA